MDKDRAEKEPQRDLERANNLILDVHKSLDHMGFIMARQPFDRDEYLEANAKWRAEATELNTLMDRLLQ
jgi:hypothetical protein